MGSKNQRPELWKLFNCRKNKEESIRVFPLSNWTELDIWLYIYREKIPIVPLYYASERPIVRRDGMLIMVDDDRFKFRKNEIIEIKKVRFRTLMLSVNGAIESKADDIASMILELQDANISERQGRAIDKDTSDSMEKKKKKVIFRHEINKSIQNVNKYIADQTNLDTVNFITCGSVDDGKSTLIGRLLFESKKVYEDQIAHLKNEQKKLEKKNNIDFAYLLDGLSAEREQGITIDVAYRYFSTDKRKFIVADTPGHKEYTRNMVTGASNADVAIVLVDARKGLLEQTRRHTMICSILGIKKIIIAINKMDLVNYSSKIFKNIELQFRQFAENLVFELILVIPMSALKGENIIESSENLNWFKGPTLISFLENVNIKAENENKNFCFPVQWVNRPNMNFRGYSGTIISGTAKVGKKSLYTLR